jgi:outer membrane protein
MRKSIIVVFLFLVCTVSFLFSDEKIGFIDSDKVINGYKGISILRDKYKKLVDDWEKEAEEKKIEIINLKKELEEQDIMLSLEAKKKKKEEIEFKESEYENFLKDIWGENGKSITKHEEILKPLIEEISNILEKIGEEEGYSLIFDISKGDIVYAKTGLDITDLVLYEINKEFTVVSPVETETRFHVFLFDEISTEAESQSLGRQMSNLIKAGLDKLTRFEPVETSRLNDALAAYGGIKEEDLGDNQVRLVARRMEANIVVFGKINLSSGIITLKLKWINFNVGTDIISQEFSIEETKKLEDLAQEVMTYLGREIKQK